jgi:hypothetical protein
MSLMYVAKTSNWLKNIVNDLNSEDYEMISYTMPPIFGFH